STPTALAVIVVIAGALAAAAGALIAVAWRVPEANQALVVTGWRPRVVRRRGTFVWPQVERAARVDMSLHDQTIDVDVTSAEGIAFRAGLECSWQVGADEPAIVEAARHFARRPGLAGRQIEGSMAARGRSAIGALPAAALLDAGVGVDLVGLISAAVGVDVNPLGLVVLSLHVTEIGDVSGYLADLVRPQLARAASDARIAAAEADAAAVEAEQRSWLVQSQPGPAPSGPAPSGQAPRPGRDPGIARSAS
ncbi:MAG: SPFH domain-containing protein, partial [Actinomycetota bacterium]|nr:SPFH domain-containing protein [Actinomycetota bacterium]